MSDVQPTPRDLTEKAAEEELGMITMKSLAQGQADIAKEMHGDRILGAVIIGVFVVLLLAHGAWSLIDHNTAHDADRSAASAQQAAAAANTAVARQDVEIASRAYSGCVSFNINQSNVREAITVSIVDAFRPFTTADKQSQLDAFGVVLRDKVEKLLPYRDCSPAGIQQSIANPPPDPNGSSPPR